MRPTRYEITVDGILPLEELEEFVGMTARYDHGTTVLDGVVRDQAALVGTVARIEALGGRVRRYLPRPDDEESRDGGNAHERRGRDRP
jgi:hypothetical protein